MSIKVTSLVWDHSQHKGGDLLVLLALADHSDDDGVSYPGVERLAYKSRLTVRHVFRVINRLVKSRELTVESNAGPMHVNLYRINVPLLRRREYRNHTSTPDILPGVTSASNGCHPNHQDPSVSSSLRSEDPPSFPPREDEGIGQDRSDEETTADHHPSLRGLAPEEVIPPPVVTLKPRQDMPVDQAVPQPPLHPPYQVLHYLNTTTGHKFRDVSFIQALLKKHKATVEECTLVIDWWDQVWCVENPGQRAYFDNKTPFRPSNFPTYLPKAERWAANGRTANGTTRAPCKHYETYVDDLSQAPTVLVRCVNCNAVLQETGEGE